MQWCWDAAQSGKNHNSKVNDNDTLTEGTILGTKYKSGFINY